MSDTDLCIVALRCDGSIFFEQSEMEVLEVNGVKYGLRVVFGSKFSEAVRQYIAITELNTGALVGVEKTKAQCIKYLNSKKYKQRYENTKKLPIYENAEKRMKEYIEFKGR